MIRKQHLAPALTLTLTLALAQALAVPAVAHADTITLTYVGTLQQVDPDPFGYAGASFSLQVTFDADATRSSSNGVDTDIFTVAGSLTVGANTLPLESEAWEVAAPVGDSIHFFLAGSSSYVRLGFASGFTGASSATNTFTPFVTSDLRTDVFAFAAGIGSATIYQSSTRTASWTIQRTNPGPQVPEPGSLLLLGAGVLGLAMRWRPRS